MRQTLIFQRSRDLRWVAEVPLSNGGTKRFVAASQELVQKKVGEWWMEGGEGGEHARKAATTDVSAHPPFAPVSAPVGVRSPSLDEAAPASLASPPSPLSPLSPPAGEWLSTWARTGRGNGHRPWGPRRHRDAILGMRRVGPIAEIPMAEVTKRDIQELLNGLSDIATTADNLRRLLHVAFADWCEQNGGTNPVSGVRVHLPASAESRLLNEDEWRALIRAVLHDPHPLASAIGVALETGLRSGELRGLRWGAVNLPERRILVRQAVTMGMDKAGGRTVEVGGLKTSTRGGVTERSVPLTRIASDLLWGAWLGKAMGDDDPDGAPARHPHPDELVWPNAKGQHRDASTLHSIFATLLTEAGIAPKRCASCGDTESQEGDETCWKCEGELVGFRLNDLRHALASHLVRVGADPVSVATWMGWKFNTRAVGIPAMLGIYGHALPANLLMLADRIGEITEELWKPYGEKGGYRPKLRLTRRTAPPANEA